MTRKSKTVLGNTIMTDPDEVVREFVDDEWVGLDLETGGLSPWTHPLAVVSLYGQKSRKTAVLHLRGYMPENLRDFLSTPGRKWITHNGTNFDLPFMRQAGIDVYAGMWHDTLVGEACAVATSRKNVSKSLQASIARRLNISIKKEHGLSNWMAPELTEEQLIYCVEDVRYLPELMMSQWERVNGTSAAEAMEFEQALSPIVTKMIMRGLPFDTASRDSFIQEVEAAKAIALAEIKELVGDLNVASPKQCLAAFEKLGIPIPKTDESTLTNLAMINSGPVGRLAAAIMLVRKANKRGMYDDTWVWKYVHDGYCHARFWQVGTDTGRFSSSEPNLQQIPKMGRKMFREEEGRSIFSVDYNQIEILIAAALSKDSRMLEIIESGADIHTAVASDIYGVPPEDVTKEQRSLSKGGSFTLIFCGGPKKIYETARLAGAAVSLQQCYELKDRFLRRFPGIDAMRNKAYARAQSGGPVVLTFPTGLRRVLVGADLSPTRIVNNVVQGAAAAGLKHALVEMNRRGVIDYVGALVHDETVGSAPDRDVEEVLREVKESMVVGMKKVVPVTARVAGTYGREWK